MQHHTAEQLHIKMALLDGAFCCLTHGSKSLRQDFIQRIILDFRQLLFQLLQPFLQLPGRQFAAFQIKPVLGFRDAFFRFL